MKNLLLLLATVISFISCEEVVDINLHDGNQQLVINAQFAVGNDSLSMPLTTTGRFTDAAGIGPVSNASIFITDQNGNTGLFSETTTGQYLLVNYGFVTGNTYSLSATDGVRTAHATSTVPAKAMIDSVQLEVIQLSGFDFYNVHVYTVDPAPEANYFRSRLSYYHFPFQESSNAIADVLNTNGVIDVPIPYGGSFFHGDTLTIELWSMDEPGFQFYRTFNQAANSHPSSSASPFNVTSNVLGGLGLFTIYQRDEYTYIVD